MGFFSSLKRSFAKEVLDDIFDVENPATQELLGLDPLGLATDSSVFNPAGTDNKPTAPIGRAGLSSSRFNVVGEIERARLDLFERERRITDNRSKSSLTMPNMLGDGEAGPKLLAEVL